MSKKNIVAQEKLTNGRVRITFESHDGNRTYEYANSSARAILRGTDPGQLKGKLIEHKKKQK
jgi:hypothetical protein